MNDRSGDEEVPAQRDSEGAARPSLGIAPGTRMRWDEQTRLRYRGQMIVGGSPWGVSRPSDAARGFVRRLYMAGPDGAVPGDARDRAVADMLVERGYAHPDPAPREAPTNVDVVVPAYGRADLLDRCLSSLNGCSRIVVDDASPDASAIERVARNHGARLVRHALNEGPASARNTGLAASDAPIVAFLDSDCVAPPRWLERLSPHFDDPRVGIVAPRVRPHAAMDTMLARYEDTRSSLDMGTRPALVRPGGPLGFVPSAAMLVRRAAVGGEPFEPGMRLGEDVDLVWRMVEAGWHVRYEPSVTVTHEMRLAVAEWIRRRYEYGTSAASLEARHPDHLAPARVSSWNLLVMALVITRRPRAAAAVAATALGLLTLHTRRIGVPPQLGARIFAEGFVADALAVGHAFRREWWPLGWVALGAAPRSRVAAGIAFAMLAPTALEYVRHRPRLDVLRYVLLRLADDAAYGSGVIASACRHLRPAVLVPHIRWPSLAVRRPTTGGRSRTTRSCCWPRRGQWRGRSTSSSPPASRSAG